MLTGLIAVDGLRLRQVSNGKRFRKTFLSEGYVWPKSQPHIKTLIVNDSSKVAQEIVHELQVKKKRMRDY